MFVTNRKETSNKHSWRRHLRLSLRSLLVLVLLTASGMSWIVHSAHVQRDTVAAIERAGDKVWYDWEWKNGRPNPNGHFWWPKWLVDRIGVDYFGHVASVYASRVSDAELVHIGKLRWLECLLLSRSFVTDAGLANLVGMRSLLVLNLQHTKISNARAHALRRS